MSFNSKNIQKKQWLLGGGFLLVISLAMGSLFYSSSSEVESQGLPLVQDKKISLPSDNLEIEEMWKGRKDQEMKLSNQKIKLLSEEVVQSRRREEEKDRKLEGLERKAFKADQLEEKFLILEKEIKTIRSNSEEKSSLESFSSPRFHGKNSSSGSSDESFQSKDAPFEKFTPRKIKIASLRTVEKDKVKDMRRGIPAGTTVKAVLISSLDAPCGVMASSDPRPVILRVLGDGKRPFGATVPIKGSLVVGSAYGNLNDEKIQIRLERLSLNKSDGTYIETQVTGYVSGEDGLYGVRGVVVDKSAKLVKTATYTGFLGGLSQFLNSTMATQSISQATQGLPANAKWDILKQSGGQGANNALEKLSDYYIKRAEQIEPVIHVDAGRLVDINFTHECEMGDLHARRNVEKVREENRNRND
jgi:conjugal transfer pilus assembly protein TraB